MSEQTETSNEDLSNGNETEDTGKPFDMDSALDSISVGLGFEKKEETTDNPPIEKPAPPEAAKPAEANPLATPDTAPNTWTKEEKDLWPTIPLDVKKIFLRREEDIRNGIEQYKGKSEFGESMQQAIAPFKPILDQHNIDPVKQVNALLNNHYTLALGTPEQKTALLQKIVTDYGLDLSSLGAQDSANIPPEYQNLQNKYNDLAQKHNQLYNSIQQERKTQLGQTVEAFSSDPKNVYFEEVYPEMSSLIRGGVAKTLKEAYEKAIYLNPQVRQKEIARLETEQKALKEAEAKSKAANISKATSVNLKGVAKDRTASRPLGTMEDTMRETLAAINARSS